MVDLGPGALIVTGILPSHDTELQGRFAAFSMYIVAGTTVEVAGEHVAAVICSLIRFCGRVIAECTDSVDRWSLQQLPGEQMLRRRQRG